MIGDDAHGPVHHQPTGSAQKAANDGVGDEADRAARAGETKHEEEDASQRSGQGNHDHDRREKVVRRTHRDQALGNGRRERGGDGGSGSVRCRDSEGKRAPYGDEGGTDRARDKGRGKAVREPRIQRRREDEGREGQSIGDRHDARGHAGEEIPRSR